MSKEQKKILIVQGDWEAGMSLLALDLKDVGHKVGKVVFCVPDLCYKLRGIQTHVFRKPIVDFEDWITDLITEEQYDTVFLYNYYRPYNQIAGKIAKEKNLGCYVFELGLIRPNCVTVFNVHCEPLTSIAKEWEKLLVNGKPPMSENVPKVLQRVSSYVKLFSFSFNFILSRITSPLFPNFVDQKEMNLCYEIKHGIFFLWRYITRSIDRELDQEFSGNLAGKYYVVPLQVHSDAQIINNSNYDSIEQFISEVVTSFEKYAPPGTKLVFKHHPMDRGYKDYSDLLVSLNEKLGGNRIIYVDRVGLPNLLSHASGLVNINSSVGISALVHHLPVIALGKAVYDLPELSYQGDLDSFWQCAERPSPMKVEWFINLLLITNQSRGTLSQRCFDVPGRCKIRWVEPFREEFFD
jgi:capsular polysaccharide export protein